MEVGAISVLSISFIWNASVVVKLICNSLLLINSTFFLFKHFMITIYSHSPPCCGVTFCHISEMPSWWLRNLTMVRKRGKCKIHATLHCFTAFISSSYHTKQQNPWPNSSASHVVNYNWLSACQGGMEPFEGDPNTRGCRTSLRNKPQQKQLRQLSASILTYPNC